MITVHLLYSQYTPTLYDANAYFILCAVVYDVE